EDALEAAVRRIRSDYPELTVRPVAGDFLQPMDLPAQLDGGPRVGFFPGSTIGNFEPAQAVRFLTAARRMLGAESELILGVDLVKPVEDLVAAYDDKGGLTARFNKNLLVRANAELGADFDTVAF